MGFVQRSPGGTGARGRGPPPAPCGGRRAAAPSLVPLPLLRRSRRSPHPPRPPLPPEGAGGRKAASGGGSQGISCQYVVSISNARERDKGGGGGGIGIHANRCRSRISSRRRCPAHPRKCRKRPKNGGGGGGFARICPGLSRFGPFLPVSGPFGAAPSLFFEPRPALILQNGSKSPDFQEKRACPSRFYSNQHKFFAILPGMILNLTFTYIVCIM